MHELAVLSTPWELQEDDTDRPDVRSMPDLSIVHPHDASSSSSSSNDNCTHMSQVSSSSNNLPYGPHQSSDNTNIAVDSVAGSCERRGSGHRCQWLSPVSSSSGTLPYVPHAHVPDGANALQSHLEECHQSRPNDDNGEANMHSTGVPAQLKQPPVHVSNSMPKRQSVNLTSEPDVVVVRTDITGVLTALDSSSRMFTYTSSSIYSVNRQLRWTIGSKAASTHCLQGSMQQAFVHALSATDQEEVDFSLHLPSGTGTMGSRITKHYHMSSSVCSSETQLSRNTTTEHGCDARTVRCTLVYAVGPSTRYGTQSVARGVYDVTDSEHGTMSQPADKLMPHPMFIQQQPRHSGSRFAGDVVTDTFTGWDDVPSAYTRTSRVAAAPATQTVRQLPTAYSSDTLHPSGAFNCAHAHAPRPMSVDYSGIMSEKASTSLHGTSVHHSTSWATHIPGSQLMHNSAQNTACAYTTVPYSVCGADAPHPGWAGRSANV